MGKLRSSSPSSGQVTIKHSYAGLNYIDTYHRSGLYPLPLPATIGMEGAGEVIEAGEGTELLKKGDKVVYALGPPGSYSDVRNIPEKKLIKIDYVDEKTAAAIMLKGMTVEYLIERNSLINNFQYGAFTCCCRWRRTNSNTMDKARGQKSLELSAV